MSARDRSREERSLPTLRKCKRCSNERQVRSKGDVNPYCASCTQIIRREQRAAVPQAMCLVTLHRIERWHMYERASRVC